MDILNILSGQAVTAHHHAFGYGGQCPPYIY
jgi:hypothetical protein